MSGITLWGTIGLTSKDDASVLNSFNLTILYNHLERLIRYRGKNKKYIQTNKGFVKLLIKSELKSGIKKNLKFVKHVILKYPKCEASRRLFSTLHYLKENA